MPIATTTAGGRTVLTPAAERVIENATAKRARVAAEAKAKRADVTTPIPPPFAVETLPEPPLFDDTPPAPARQITLSATVLYRDYRITIHAEGLTLAAFGALLGEPLGALVLPFNVTVQFGGREITIRAEGLALDRLCDMLDQRLGVVS